MQNDDPLGIRVPGTHYKAYLVASLALTSARDAAIQHYKLTAEQVAWAEEWYLANGPEIYDAIAEARRIGDELGAEVGQIALEKMRGNDDPEALLAIEAKRTLFGVSMALEHETRLLETVAERYNVEKLLMIRAESKMLVGRPLVFLYDAAEGHRLSDSIGRSRLTNPMTAAKRKTGIPKSISAILQRADFSLRQQSTEILSYFCRSSGSVLTP